MTDSTPLQFPDVASLATGYPQLDMVSTVLWNYIEFAGQQNVLTLDQLVANCWQLLTVRKFTSCDDIDDAKLSHSSLEFAIAMRKSVIRSLISMHLKRYIDTKSLRELPY